MRLARRLNDWRHLCFVAAAHRALKSCKLVQECTTPLERLALLTAALGHDAGHDGVNNAFHVQAYSELSHLYLPTYLHLLLHFKPCMTDIYLRN